MRLPSTIPPKVSRQVSFPTPTQFEIDLFHHRSNFHSLNHLPRHSPLIIYLMSPNRLHISQLLKPFSPSRKTAKMATSTQTNLDITSTVKLPSGYTMPILGLGVRTSPPLPSVKTTPSNNPGLPNTPLPHQSRSLPRPRNRLPPDRLRARLPQRSPLCPRHEHQRHPPLRAFLHLENILQRPLLHRDRVSNQCHARSHRAIVHRSHAHPCPIRRITGTQRGVESAGRGSGGWENTKHRR